MALRCVGAEIGIRETHPDQEFEKSPPLASENHRDSEKDWFDHLVSP